MKPTETTCWKCACCGKVFIDRELAEKCCVCRVCGKEGVRLPYAGDQCADCWNRASARRDRERWEKAQKVAPGSVGECYISRLDIYCDNSDVDSVLEAADEYLFGDEPVEAGRTREQAYDCLHVWACREEPIAISADRILEALEEEAYEDYETDSEGEQLICDFCDTWNEEYAKIMYVPDYKLAISATASGKDEADGCDV